MLSEQGSRKLKSMLMDHEGYSTYPYECTSGALTVGWGHNLTANGVTPAVAALMLSEDVSYFLEQLPKHLVYWCKLDEARKIVLTNMAFNLGISGLMSFKLMHHALEDGDYERAAHEMIASKWAKQVKGRADELSRIMMTGELDAI